MSASHDIMCVFCDHWYTVTIMYVPMYSYVWATDRLQSLSNWVLYVTKSCSYTHKTRGLRWCDLANGRVNLLKGGKWWRGETRLVKVRTLNIVVLNVIYFDRIGIQALTSVLTFSWLFLWCASDSAPLLCTKWSQLDFYLVMFVCCTSLIKVKVLTCYICSYEYI